MRITREVLLAVCTSLLAGPSILAEKLTPLAVRVDSDGPVVLTEPFTVTAEVENKTGLPITLADMHLALPKPLACGQRTDTIEFENASLDLDVDGIATDLTAKVPQIRYQPQRVATTLCVLIYPYKSYDAKVVVHYFVGERKYQAEGHLALQPRSPVWAPVVGGLLGLGITVLCLRLLVPSQGSRKSLSIALAQGGVVIPIAIVLARFARAAVPSLPVSPDDAAGGLVLGMSYQSVIAYFRAKISH